MADHKKTGVYAIRHRESGKVYVGSTAHRQGFKKRWCDHRTSLSKGRHHSVYLQNAWTKYGEEAFEFVILTVCPPDDCIRFEQEAINTYQSLDRDKGYNICPSAGSCLGRKLTDEHKANIGSGNRGKKPSDEVRKRMSERMRGHKHTQEALAKLSATITGRKMSDEARANMSAAQGTPEARAKMSARTKGIKKSAETKAKMKSAQNRPEAKIRIASIHRGRKRSAETKAKMSAAQLGRKFSSEARAKMSAAKKGRVKTYRTKNVYASLFND